MCVSIDPGPHKGKVLQLSTGRARVHSKTDCWISFDQYMEFARCLLILCAAETSKVLLVDWAVFAWLKIYLWWLPSFAGMCIPDSNLHIMVPQATRHSGLGYFWTKWDYIWRMTHKEQARCEISSTQLVRWISSPSHSLPKPAGLTMMQVMCSLEHYPVNLTFCNNLNYSFCMCIHCMGSFKYIIADNHCVDEHGMNINPAYMQTVMIKAFAVVRVVYQRVLCDLGKLQQWFCN